MKALARLAGAILSLLFDMRRVKCPDHWLNPMTNPPQCLTCWDTSP